MTNKEFFINVLRDEHPTFLKVIQALPDNKLDYKVHEKSRTSGSLAFQLAMQWYFIDAIVKTGTPEFGEYQQPEPDSVEEMAEISKKNFEQLMQTLEQISDQEWENGTARMEWPGGKWETRKYEMAWGFFFDAIHHRGQLTTYLRAMGAKVPGVYGGSADEAPQSV